VIKLTRLASLSLLVLALSCGGGSGDDGDGGNTPGPDAGPDAMAMALGHDARGAYAGALMLAQWEQADEQLYRLTGDYLVFAGRETDPAQMSSFWTFSFISPSTGVTVDIVYSRGVYGPPYVSSTNPEGKRLVGDDWFGSIEAVNYLVQAGYTEPPAGDPNYRVGATLEMPPDTSIVDPVWRITKTYAPPGMPSMGEQWIVLYSTADGGIVVCDPGGNCILI
jgi:hypothetical protein